MQLFSMIATFFLVLILPTICVADGINTATGEYIIGLDGGDSVTASGEYIINLEGGDSINTATGEYIIGLDGGDSVTASGEYIINLEDDDSVNATTGEYIIDLDDVIEKYKNKLNKWICEVTSCIKPHD